MLDIRETTSAVKAIYLQSASLSGFEVSAESPEVLAQIAADGFKRVESARRPEAVANLLKVIAATLEIAQGEGATMLHEGNVRAGSSKVCPIYPFD
jgi:hypothetical protein